MGFNQSCVISLNGKPSKLVNHFIYLGSNISSTESDVNIRKGYAWTAIDRSDKIKFEYFQAVAVSVLLYSRTTWTLTEHLEKKLDKNYQNNRSMSRFWVFSFFFWQSRKQNPKKQYLYGFLPLFTQTFLDILDIVGEESKKTSATIARGLLHMDTPILADLLYNYGMIFFH